MELWLVRLLSYKSNTYIYNKIGQLEETRNSSGTTRYEYEVLGNLRKLMLPNGDIIDCQIDVLH